MSIRKAVEVFNVPYTTLRRHCKGELKSNQYEKKLGTIRTVLRNDEEVELESLILAMDNSFYGLIIDDLRRVAYQHCVRKNIKRPFNKQTETAGRDFVSGFLRRRENISLRKPESVSLSRVFGLNKTSVQTYFDKFEVVLEKYYFQPHQIYNVDESGLTCVHKPIKVLAQKGKRVVSSATSGERGVTTTILCCYNAVGYYVLPMMIFKRKYVKPELTDHAPAGTLNNVSENGWINGPLFVSYMEHFVKHVKTSKESNVLLILDGHSTHT